MDKDTPKLANVRHVIRRGERLPPGHVYIGRANRSWGLEASPLANPFPVMEYADPKYCLEDFRRWLWARLRRDLAMAETLHSIRPDDVLCCWCVDKQGNGECHGRIVIAAWKWLQGNGGTGR